MSKQPRPRVAFVVQRAGHDVNGGAEHLCLQIALRMSSHWHIEILTTRAKDYLTWRDHYAAGVEPLNEHCRIVRFGVDFERHIPSFGPLCQRLERGLANHRATAAQELEWIRAQGPVSSALKNYVVENAKAYDAFFFFCYQYGTTSLVLPEVAHKSFVVPCAHDEWSLHLATFGQVLAQAAAHIYLSPEEGALVRGALGQHGRTAPPGTVSAVGFDGAPLGDAERFRAKTGITGPFALYLGRIDEGKNTPQLFDYWQRMYVESRQRHKLPQLVLVGGAGTSVLYHESVRYLGFVDEGTRNDALAACRFLINPSRYESLSLVLLEAWAATKPVLVNGDCAVMQGQVKRAAGGLAFTDYTSFVAAVYAMHDEDARKAWGGSGQRYVAREYRWAQVEATYLDLFASVRAGGRDES